MKEIIEEIEISGLKHQETERLNWKPEIGMTVMVAMGDGRLDGGWEISEILNSQAIVSKYDVVTKIKEFSMSVSLENLRRVNQPGGVDFSQAKSFNDLEVLLLNNGLVEGSSKSYSVQEIMEIIQNIKERNDTPFQLLPRANNLRETVERLYKEYVAKNESFSKREENDEEKHFFPYK